MAGTPNWSPGGTFPKFPAPVAGQKMTKGVKDTRMQNAVWKLFWQKPVEEQVASFQQRPLLGWYVTNNIEKRPNCIRDPKTGASVEMVIKCHYTQGLHKLVCDKKDPYLTENEYCNHLAQRGSWPPGDWFLFEFEVGSGGASSRGSQSSSASAVQLRYILFRFLRFLLTLIS